MAQVDQIFPHGFQWHHKVHEEWGKESLWFAFLAVEPTYQRRHMTTKVEHAMEELGVRSYVVYELTGQYDMLLRAWVPDHRAKEFERKVEKLPGYGQCHFFRGAEVIHHWVWQVTERSEIGHMKMPEEDLQRPPVSRELEALNELQRRSADTDVPADELEVDDEMRDIYSRYKKSKMLAVPPYETGIKFLVQVRIGNPGDVEQRAYVQSQICEALGNAQGAIWDRSLYFSRSSAFQFMVMGRAPIAPNPHTGGKSPFHQITPLLLDEIARIAGAGGTKTVTHFFPLDGFLAFKDEMRVPPRPSHHVPDFDRLLNSPEGHDFEVKGAAFAALDKWVRGRGDLEVSSDVDDQPFLSVLDAVTSLLNGNGGTVLLGALERRVYGGAARAKELPIVGKHLVLGLEGVDFPEGEYDTYSRSLWDKLHQRICPSPRGWLEFYPHEVDGRTVLAITVQFPDEWFWARRGKKGQEFVVRSNAASTALHGADAEDYRRRHPRRGQ
jgi:hypothetical protein